MICRIVIANRIGRILTCLTFLTCYHEFLMARDDAPGGTQASLSALHVKHILGFEGISKNSSGDLSIQAGYFRFQKSENSSARIPVSSIQELTLGEQDKQVGGISMMLAKTAAPYGGGRVISLFSHKKYDTVALEYVDSNGALHGAIFQLNKGKGQVLRSELDAARAHMTDIEDVTVKGSAQETTNEAK